MRDTDLTERLATSPPPMMAGRFTALTRRDDMSVRCGR